MDKIPFAFADGKDTTLPELPKNCIRIVTVQSRSEFMHFGARSKMDDSHFEVSHR